MDSRRKGNLAENEVCRALSQWLGPEKRDYVTCAVTSLPFRRRTTSIAPSTGSWEGSGDILFVKGERIICPFSIECKKVQGWELDGLMYSSSVDPWEWWEQAKGQAEGCDDFPLLVLTRNRRPVYAMLETKVARCLKLKPVNGPLVELQRPHGERVTLSLLSDLILTSRKLVARLAGQFSYLKKGS